MALRVRWAARDRWTVTLNSLYRPKEARRQIVRKPMSEAVLKPPLMSRWVDGPQWVDTGPMTPDRESDCRDKAGDSKGRLSRIDGLRSSRARHRRGARERSRLQFGTFNTALWIADTNGYS